MRCLLLVILLGRIFFICIILLWLFLGGSQLLFFFFIIIHLSASFSLLVGLVYGLSVRFSMVGNLELHLIRYISDRVEDLSHDGDGLGGEIGKEGDGHEEEDGGESRRTYHVFQILHHIESVLSARVEGEVAHQWGEELGEGDARPEHDDHHAEEPLPQVDGIYMHQLESRHRHEAWKQEGWETEVQRHEPVRDDGTHRTAIVLELLLRVGPFARSQVFEQTLVCRSRIDERNHRNE